MKNGVYDIYLMNLNGTAIFCGCTGSEYCQQHVGQHELHTGFFSAIYGFSREAFQEGELQGVTLGKVQLNFKIDSPNQIMLALVHPGEVKLKVVRRQMEQVMRLYISKFQNRVQPHVVDEQLQAEFMDQIRALGITTATTIHPVGKMQMSSDKLVEKVTGILQQE